MDIRYGVEHQNINEWQPVYEIIFKLFIDYIIELCIDKFKFHVRILEIALFVKFNTADRIDIGLRICFSAKFDNFILSF